jgi:hypothetical protein
MRYPWVRTADGIGGPFHLRVDGVELPQIRVICGAKVEAINGQCEFYEPGAGIETPWNACALCATGKPNPFAGSVPGHPELQAVDTESRIRMVQNFTIDQCNQALHLPRLQKTVATAILRRVRALKKEPHAGR